MNGATCDPTNGQCVCGPGWTGIACNESKYDPGILLSVADSQ